MSETSDLGLFPLGMVLLPGERVPLHLFEPRYRQLAADCILEDRPFALVRAGDESLARVGCRARFDALVRRFADGRMNVIVLGLDPVEIGDETEGHLYLSAEVEPLADEPGGGEEDDAAQVGALFRRLAEQVTGAASDPPHAEGVPLSYAVAGSVELPPDTKQELLEDRNEASRLRRVRGLLEAAVAGIDRSRLAAERGQRNGKVTAQ